MAGHIAQRENGTKSDAWIAGMARRCAAALCGVLLLAASNAALADQFYFTRTKAPSTGTGDEGATLLVRWDDAAGTQTLLSTPHISHATDGRVSVSAIATSGGTLYGLVVDDTSNAPLVPYNGCTTTCRSRLATINPANGTITWVGAWLNGVNFDGAGFDPSGRLWVADSVTGDVYRLDPATGAIIGSPIQTNATTVAGDIDFLSNGLGIFGYGGFTFVTFDPDTGAVGTGSFSATNSGFDGTLVPPYALSGIAFTNHLAARNGSAAATTCRINVGEGRGVDELGHVNDPWTTAAPIARKERDQLDPPNWAVGYMNAGQGDMARVGGPAFPACIFDLGDAPNASYATTIASNGARHQIGGPMLGTGLPDVDVNGAPNATASGDDSANTDDEDGVVVPALTLGSTAQIQVRVAGAGDATRLQGWIDWGRDGGFAQAGDRILTDAAVTDGNNTFDIAVPATAVAGATYARFRIANQSGMGPAGMATTGEVEDYQVQVIQPTFGSCSSNMYLAQGAPTGLLGIGTASNPFTYSPIGPASAVTYNGVAFNPADNYLYAMGLVGGSQTLFRIGGDGSVQELGAVSGGGLDGSNPISAGEIGPDGAYYVKRAEATSQMWRIDIATRTASVINLSQAVWLGDLAWYSGRLYAHSHETGLLYAIDPASGATTTVGNTGIANVPFGALFGASNGLYGARNDGGFYRFDTTTGAVTLISGSPASSNNDGAKCATSPMSFAADLSITKTDGSAVYTPGNNVIYQIVVSNGGPFGVQNAQVSDALPTGVSSATWTCGSATNGATCGVASGGGAISTTANLPANSSVTYTLTLFVPSTFSGSLVNTATVTAPPGTTDSNTGNNTASDTDSQFPAPPANVADLTCRSDASVLNTAYDGNGGRLTSGNDMHWQVALTTTPITGAPPAGLTYGAAAVATNPPAIYMVSPYGNANWISHAANALHPTSVNYDVFYRYQMNLGPGTDPSTLAPRLDFYSDNSVYEIWVNGVAQGIRSNYGAADPYFYAGFTAANPASGTLVGPWSTGANEIVVHVKSGPGAQAFLAQVVLPQSICQPATVALNKTTRLVAGGAFGFGLTNTAQASGTVTTTAPDTATPADGDSSSAGTVEPFAVTSFGTDVVITENSLPPGWLLEDAVCTSNGTPVGARSGSSYTIPGAQIDASGESFVCSFANTPTVNLRLEKTANPTALRSRQPVTYTFRLDNDGPGPGDGAVFRDPAIDGVDCSTATLSCSASGGAVCPASPAVAMLQSSGIVLPTFPPGGALQFGMTCNVTASGQ